MGRIIEGYWDCPYCGGKEIRGSIQTCPTCGKTRDNSTKFYMKDTKNYVSDEEAAKTSKNPDWLCSYCNSYNSDDNLACINCGHKRDEEDNSYFGVQNTENQNASSIDDTPPTVNRYQNLPKEPKAELFMSRFSKSYVPLPKKMNTRQKKEIAKLVSLILVFGFTIAMFCYMLIPKAMDVNVNELAWNSTVYIEIEKTLSESDWSVPPGGRQTRTAREFHHNEQVLDHYETVKEDYTEQVSDGYETKITGHRDLGNGRFEEITSQVPKYKTVTKTRSVEKPVYRNEPVYQTKYYYDIERWVPSRQLPTNGTDKNPVYAEYVLVEKERLKNTATIYTVSLKNEDGEIFIEEIGELLWSVLEENSTIQIKTNNAKQIFIDEEALVLAANR